VISLGLETSIWCRVGGHGPLAGCRDQLAELLWFLTDDTWHISFRCPSRRPPYQRSLFPEPVPDGAELALFSGGLDSMAGLWARNRQEKRTFVAVSVSGNRIRRDVQRCSVESLQELGADVTLGRSAATPSWREEAREFAANARVPFSTALARRYPVPFAWLP